jgi:hypothetical protein
MSETRISGSDDAGGRRPWPSRSRAATSLAGLSADFRTGTSALESGELEPELASAPPRDCGVVGQAGVAQDG